MRFSSASKMVSVVTEVTLGLPFTHKPGLENPRPLWAGSFRLVAYTRCLPFPEPE